MTPTTSFASLGLRRPLLEALEAQRLEQPTPIQALVLPDALVGRDVYGLAPTGTGKTLAFGLAVIERLAGEPPSNAGPRGLILAPTRELAAQIGSSLSRLASRASVRVGVVTGGQGYRRQLAMLRRGLDVVVATPGRLLDLLARRALTLSAVRIVVVDEVDRMSDLGFFPALQTLVRATPPTRQTMLFSATQHARVDALLEEACRGPVTHSTLHQAKLTSTATHHFWRVAPRDRVAVTAATVRAGGPAIVFCRTRAGALRLAEALGEHGISCALLHGGLGQRERSEALARFRAGRLDAIVTTDVLARGIHVEAVPLVVHFDPAWRCDDYVHRSGRTARAGLRGHVVSLVAPREASRVRLLTRALSLSGSLVAADPRALGVVRTQRQTPAAATSVQRTSSARASGRDRRSRRAS